MKVGDMVSYRGRFTRSGLFPLRGVVELVKDDLVGVRLENGNFVWADANQVRVR